MEFLVDVIPELADLFSNHKDKIETIKNAAEIVFAIIRCAQLDPDVSSKLVDSLNEVRDYYIDDEEIYEAFSTLIANLQFEDIMGVWLVIIYAND